MLMFLNGHTDGYKIDLFTGVISYMEKVSGEQYTQNQKSTKAMRIVADHIRTGVMLMGDINGILPSNTGAGYILRRLLRRAIRHSKSLNMTADDLLQVATIYIDEVYNEAYPLLVEKKAYILDELAKEIKKFEATLTQGIKEFEKVITSIQRKREFLQKQNSTEEVLDIINLLLDDLSYPAELDESVSRRYIYIYTHRIQFCLCAVLFNSSSIRSCYVS